MGELLALMTALLWALGVVMYKKSVGFVAPFSLNVFKNCVAFVLLAVTTVLLGQSRSLSVPPKDLAVILISGALGIGVSDTFYFMALSRLGASRTALMDCLYSPFVILFSFLMLNETLAPLNIVGGLLILSSVAASTQRHFGHSIGRKQLWTGCAFAAAAMATVGFAVVLVSPLLPRYPLAWVSTVRMAGGIIFVLLVVPVHPNRKSVYEVFRPQPGWKWMLLGTFFGSYLSLMCWLAGFKYSRAGVAALLNQTSTVVIVLLAALFLHEPLTKLKIVAVALAFIGVALVLYR
jgi:drug/metabolite transporter (DMT)-like permease